MRHAFRIVKYSKFCSSHVWTRRSFRINALMVQHKSQENQVKHQTTKFGQVSQKIVSKISTRFETFSKSVLADLGTVFGPFFDPRSCLKGVRTGLGLQTLAQEAPKGYQDAPKRLLRTPKSCSRGSQEAPKGLSRRS